MRQLYSDGSKVQCRLASDSAVVDGPSSYPCAVSAPGNLYLATTRAITVDHLRVFQY